MKRSLLPLLLLSFLPVVPAPAQDETPAAEEENANVEDSDNPRQRFWEARLPGGNYLVALDRIASVSMHEYVLDAQLIVNEVVVDTGGRALARFYHVREAAAGAEAAAARRVVERGRDLLDRAGQRAGVNVHDMAQKNYPATSHAGTIEYRILDLRDLQAIYDSLKNAWESGRGRRITVQ